MEERHKRILQRNRVNLVRDLNPSDMYHGLLSKGIFTQDMIDEIKVSSGIRQGQARQLVRDLETRGSLAFPALIECLHETGQHSLAELLLDGEPQNQPLPQPVHVRPVVRPLPVLLIKVSEYLFKCDISTYSVSCLVKIATSLNLSPTSSLIVWIYCGIFACFTFIFSQSYKMDANPCGHCLIINNVDFEPKSELSNFRIHGQRPLQTDAWFL
uniref:CARD domain-containing protein n=1 Tax=Oncorhynchus kisutch TaxID=8019 RepID=A0A8C7HKA8_ONCKI